MNKLTSTAKGQVTLRKDLLEYLDVEPGEKIVVDKLSDGQRARRGDFCLV